MTTPYHQRDLTKGNRNTDAATLDSFFVMDDEPALPVVDRSTLQNYATCPAMARFVEAGQVNTSSAIANAGEEGHRAIGRTLADYVAEQGHINERGSPKAKLAEKLEAELLAARPDVHPEVQLAFRRSCWAWAEFVSGINFANLLHFDGGAGKRSGQLAADFGGAVRLTAELDLLYAGASPKVLEIVDYKSGWKLHSHDDVRDSFQFGFQSWLVFANYPESEAVRVRVWNSRSNLMTFPIYFTREQCSVTTERREHGPDVMRTGAVYARIHEAVAVWMRERGKAPQDAPAWPEVAKCGFCPAASLCPAAGVQVAEVAADPAGYVRKMFALENTLDAMRKLAGKYVEANGDIEAPDVGVAFGADKPKSSRKPPKTLYEIRSSEDSNQGES